MQEYLFTVPPSHNSRQTPDFTSPNPDVTIFSKKGNPSPPALKKKKKNAVRYDNKSTLKTIPLGTGLFLSNTSREEKRTRKGRIFFLEMLKTLDSELLLRLRRPDLPTPRLDGQAEPKVPQAAELNDGDPDTVARNSLAKTTLYKIRTRKSKKKKKKLTTSPE